MQCPGGAEGEGESCGSVAQGNRDRGRQEGEDLTTSGFTKTSLSSATGYEKKGLKKYIVNFF